MTKLNGWAVATALAVTTALTADHWHLTRGGPPGLGDLALAVLGRFV